MRLSILVVMLLLHSVEVSAQFADVRGVVTDSVTNERIPYANVLLKDTKYGSATNTVGFYLIPRVPTGSYELVVSSVGYRKAMLRIIVPISGVVELNIKLAPAAIETEEVIVTGESKERLQAIISSFRILDQAAIKATPMMVQPDPFQTFKLLPGVVSTSDVSGRLYVRGGNADQNVVLLDGMRLYHPFHAYGIFSVIDPDIVRTAEVYTGAFPAAYGGGLSSVIDIAARDPRGDRVGAKAQVTMLASKLQMEIPMGDWGVSLNARKTIFPSVLRHLSRENAPLTFHDVFLKTSSQSESGVKVSASAIVSSDQFNTGGSIGPSYSWTTGGGSVSISSLLSDRLFTTTTAHYTMYKALRERGNTAEPSLESRVSDGGIRSVATLYETVTTEYEFGFDFNFPSVDASIINPLKQIVRVRDVSPEIAFMASYKTILEPFTFSLGLRLEPGSFFTRRLSLDYVQPRMHVTYTDGGRWRVKGSYGRYSQNLLTATNEDDIVSLFDVWLKIPEQMRSGQADHYVLGGEVEVTKGLELKLEAYLKRFNSLILVNRRKIDSSDPDYVTGKGNASGAELSASFSKGPVDCTISYAVSRARVNDGAESYYPRFDRRHQLNGLISARILRDLDVNVHWQFGSGFPFTQIAGYIEELSMRRFYPELFELERGTTRPVYARRNAARLPNYHRLDVSLSYTVRFGEARGSLGLSVMNLFDRRNIFYYDRDRGDRVNMLRFFPSAVFTLEY